MASQKRERSRTSRPLSMLFADSFALFKKPSSAMPNEPPAGSNFPELPSRTSVAAPPSPPRSHHASASTASTASSFDTPTDNKPYLTLSLDHHPSAASLVPEHLLDDSHKQCETASMAAVVSGPPSSDTASTRTSISLVSSRRVSKNHGVYIYLGNSEFSEEEAFNPFEDLV